MRAPDTKKPVKRRLPVLPPPGVDRMMGSPRSLLSGSAASQHQLREALTILNPPSAKRESWLKKIHQALAVRDMRWIDNVEFDERRSRGHPANKWARDRVELARDVLETFGLELTKKRKDKWHRLSQMFGETDADLRHHLEDSLRDRPLAEKS